MKLIGLSQRVERLKDRDERRDCLDQNWINLLTQMGMMPIPLPNHTGDVQGMVSELKLDGVILTGGNDLNHLPGAKNIAPERDLFEERLLRICSECSIPVLGVCRGMQMMVNHHGGELIPVKQHVATCHQLKVLRKDVMPLIDRDEVNSFHNFGVDSKGVGNDLLVIATAHDGTVEAVAHEMFPQWGIMWHPERPPNDERDVSIIMALFK